MIVLFEVTGISPSFSSRLAHNDALRGDLKYEKLYCSPFAFCECVTIPIKVNGKAPSKFTKLALARIRDHLVCLL